MDIQRLSNTHAKKIRRIIYACVAVVSVAGVAFGVTRLRPAAPSVDKATIWTDEVKRGPMLSDVYGLGTLALWDRRTYTEQSCRFVIQISPNAAKQILTIPNGIN